MTMLRRGSRHHWVVAQIGAREHYAIASALHARGLLRELITDYWSPPGASLPRSTLLRALRQRRSPDIPERLVASFNLRTLGQHLLRPLWHGASPYLTFAREGRAFGRRAANCLASLASRGEVDCFFGYTTGSLEVMQRLRGTGVVCILDQIDPSIVEEEIVQQERAEFPEWEAHMQPIPSAYYERSWEEWRLADIIVVNSRWSAAALRQIGVPDHKLFILPLLFHPPQNDPPERPLGRPRLRVAWAGSVTLRKGIQYLAQAAELLQSSPVEIKVAGSIHVNPAMLAGLPKNTEILGRVTRREMRDVYNWADVYVLPTVSDGFAITQLEAMAHGLPVIATDRCGDVVQHGINGLIIPARSARDLAAAVDVFCNDRLLVQRMAAAAQRRAQEMCSEVFPRALDALIERVYHVAGGEEQDEAAPATRGA